MAVGSAITATDFNNIRNILNTNFGIGMYGIPTGTGANDIPNTVTGGNDPDTSDTVLSTDVERLFSIGQLVHYHQTGAVKSIASGTTYPDVQVGEVIEWADWGSAADVQGLYDLANSCASFNRNTTEFSGDFSQVNNNTTDYTANWQSLNVTWTHTWTSANAMTHFFMTGGEVRVTAAMSNIGTAGSASYDKNLNWQTMMSNMGTVRLFLRPNSGGTGYEWVTESLSGGGTGSTIADTNNAGPANSGNPYLAYQRNGAGSIYNDNEIRITATIAASSVTIRLDLIDGDTGTGNPADGPNSTPIDEPVTGDVRANGQISYADSTITLNDGTADTDFTLLGPTPTTATGAWAT